MRYIFLVFFIIASSIVTGQKISYSDLTHLLNCKSWEEVNQNLINKGWTYYSSSEETDDMFGTIQWSFGKNYEDKAIGWLTLYTNSDKPVKIKFQFHAKDIYNALQKSINSLGYKKDGSGILDDGLYVKYKNSLLSTYFFTTKSDDEYSTNARYIATVAKNIVGDVNSEGHKLKNGPIVEKDENGDLQCICTYKNDVLNGPYKKYQNGKLKETGTNINGVATGKFSYYIDDKLDTEGSYKDGLMDGMHTFYYYDDEGKLLYRTMGIMKKDLKNGLFNDIFKINSKDIVFQYSTYADDVLSGPFKKIEENEITIGFYKDGELDGPVKIYQDIKTKEGQFITGDLSMAYLKAEGFYKNGNKHGSWKYYDEKGSTIEVVNYLEGVKQ